jgi:hypothetical protein
VEPLPAGQTLYGIGAEFETTADLYHAAEIIRDKGYRWWDTHSPFPIHGIDHAMGLKKSWVSFVVICGSATGLTTGFLLQTLTSIERPEFLKGVPSGWLMDLFYPMIVQGKPYLSLPAFVPVMFELTILLSAFGAVLGMLIFNRLPRYHHPVFNWERFCKKHTDDSFFVVLEAVDPLFTEKDAIALLQQAGGKNITLIPE